MVGVGKHVDSETAGLERHCNAGARRSMAIPRGDVGQTRDCIMEQGVSRSDGLCVRVAVHGARNRHAGGDNAQTQQRQLHLRVPVEHA